MWTRGRFNEEYIPGLFALMVDANRTKRHMSMWRDLVTMKTSKKKKEENVIRSGLGMPAVKGEGAAVTYDTQISGPKQTWIPDVYALAVRITEEAIDDNLYELNGGGRSDDLKELAVDLGESLEENYEVLHARLFNSGTATTYHTTRFGSSYPLFSATHPRLDGSTFSNLATNADLTYDVFWSLVVAAENQTNHRQFKIQKKIKSLWTPPEYEKKAREILFSSDRPDTPNRAISSLVQSGRKIMLKVWPYITDTDMYVLQLDGEGIIHFTLRKNRFAREKDFQTGDMMIKGDQRWSVEINDEQAFYGNIPA